MLEVLKNPTALGATHQHVSRLLQAMAAVVQKKAYTAITIADIVQAAGVSKRSFYEQFESKEACFLALYRAASASALRTLRETVSPGEGWQTQVEQGLHAYLSHLAAGAGLLRALFIDIHDLGEPGAKARREVMHGLAGFMLDTVNSSPRASSTSASFTPALAMAAVGGVNELILMAIEANEVERLADLTPTCIQLVFLLTQTPQAPQDNPQR
jgi:AcrR family transcriptional regulator